MPLRAVLFDLGDTLWGFTGSDDIQVHLRHYEGALRQFPSDDGLPSAEVLYRAVGNRLVAERATWVAARHRDPQASIETLVAGALTEIGLEPLAGATEAIVAAITDAECELAARTEPEPEMPETLRALRDRGLRLGVVSNTVVTTQTLVRILEARGLHHFVEGVYSSNDIGWRKPHPNCFLPALQHLEVEAGEAIFVGDRLDTDIEGALGLGMTAVLTHQYRREDPSGSAFQPHYVIQHLRELLPIVDRVR